MGRKIIINENTLRKIIKKALKENAEWPIEAEFDRNINVFDDPSVASAYVNGNDVSYIKGCTLKDRMKNDETGTGVDYSNSEDELTNMIAEAIKKVIG